MKDYNGFSGKHRERAQRWLNKQWSVGALDRPSKCAACGQTQGVIQAHAEDYSEPFRKGVTDGFHLCITCHAMVHYRTESPDAWQKYRAKVEAGARAKFSKASQSFVGVRAHFVRRPIINELFEWGSPPLHKVLLEIERSQDESLNRSSPA